jgi:hypothetical protein
MPFKPDPDLLYFVHVQSSMEADCAGVVVVHADNGRRPCRGADSDPADNYVGDVALDDAGSPLRQMSVLYFDARERQVSETVTDDAGRHFVWLPAGTYRYCYLLATGVRRDWRAVEVPAGNAQTWETEDGELVERVVSAVGEDDVLDFHSDGGGGWSWLELEDALLKLWNTGRVRQVTFARFCRPDFVLRLQAQGVNAFDTNWKDAQFAAAHRNLRALLDARLLLLTRHDRANFQLRQLYFASEKKTAIEKGLRRYLADARAAAVTHAAQAAAFEQGAGNFRRAVLTGRELFGANDERGAEGLWQDVQAMFPQARVGGRW